MDNTKQRKIKVADGITDAFIVFLSFLLAFYIRFQLMSGSQTQQQRDAMDVQLLFTGFYAFLLMIAYYFARRYDYYRHIPVAKEIANIVLLNVVGILFYTAFLYFIDLPDFSRVAIGLFLLLSTVFVIAKRLIIIFLLRGYRRKGYNKRHILVVGSGQLARNYVEATRADTDMGFCVDGYVAKNKQPQLGRYFGSYEQLKKILEETIPDEIVIALDPQETQMMNVILTACEHSGVRTSIIPYFNDYLPSHPQIVAFGQYKLINIRAIPLDNLFSAAMKRIFDIVVSAVMLVLTSPILLIAAVGIKLTSPGPVLFCQERVGKNKKPFTMYKLRSMPTDVNHTGWSTDIDTRRTKFGSFIRKFSIDELPQLWNVLIGDMSLVGPRPEIPNYVRKFSEEIPLYLVRQQVRPGMTGFAQIHGLRGDTSIEERVKYDIAYIEDWTWLLDLKILVRTAFGGFMNREKLGKEKGEKMNVARK